MLRIGIIGFGRRGRALLPLAQSLPAALVTAIGDIDAAARQRAQLEHGLPAFNPDHETWPHEPPDVIVLATPAIGRAELVRRCATPGVQAILAEKPLALTLFEADRMQASCDGAGVQLAVAHHWRFCPAMNRLKSIIAAGRLGAIESVHAVGYGNLFDQGWHLLDATRWLLGGAQVEWAAAHGTSDRDVLSRLSSDARSFAFDPQHPAPVWTSADLQLSGGVRCRLEAGPAIQRTGAVLGDWHERRLTVVGQLGSAECRPGHYLRLGLPHSAEDELTLHPSCLDVASREMLRAVCNAARTGGPPPSPAADARETLAGLLLCGISLRDRAPAVGPVAACEDPFADLRQQPELAIARARPKPDPRAPRFSVLIPLIEERGFARQCLEGWLTQERFADEGYELVLLDAGTVPVLREELRSLLRPHDRIVGEPGSGRSTLYDHGARKARAEFVIFTESHCVPEPECLRELDRYLRMHSIDGACLRSTPVCHDAMANVDARLFESGFREFRREGDWRKVNVHGFALRRESYLRSGGLQHQYHNYAELVLAAALRDAGVRLGYAAAAGVQHHYHASLEEVVELIASFVAGEIQYRREHGSTARIGFSFLDMSAVELESPRVLWECARAEWERLKRGARRLDFSSAIGLAATWSRWWLHGTLGLRCAKWQVAWKHLQCRLWSWHPARLEVAYLGLTRAAVRCAWRFDQCHAAPVATPPDESRCWAIDELPEDWLYGFHPLEPAGDRTFRWSRPAAGIDLPLASGMYEVTLETGKIRPWPESLRWTLAGVPIERANIELQQDCVRLRLTISELRPFGRQTLAWSCQPWDVADLRPLGLPVFTVRYERVEHEQAAEPRVLPFPDAPAHWPRDIHAA